MKVKKFKFNLKELYYFGIDFLIFFLSNRPIQPFEWRAMENETFYWDCHVPKKGGGEGQGGDSKHGPYSRQGMLVWLLTYSVNKVAAIPKISFGS